MNVEELTAEIARLTALIEEHKERFVRTIRQGKFVATFGQTKGEWVVWNEASCYTDGGGPVFHKTFRGPRAQLDAQTLAYLLNKEEDKNDGSK